MAVFDIPIENVLENPKNVRKDLGDLEELVNSIKRNGIRQNLIVTPVLDDDGEETDNYRLIAGHRRLAAAKKAHLISVPCRIERDLDESDEVMAMLEENMQRRNLSPMEEGQGVQMCLDLGISMEKLEHRTGLSEQTLKHRVEIAKLDPEIYEEKDSAFQLTIHAMYALEKIKDINKRNEVLKGATDNQNLIWRANNAAEQEKKDEYKAAVVEFLEHQGIFKVPDGVQTWSNGWKNLGSIDYSYDRCGESARKLIKEIEETMKINIMEETVDYLIQSYGSMIYILYKKAEEEPDDDGGTDSYSSQEEARRKREETRKQMQKIWKVWQKDIVKFCKNAIDGKYTCPKDKVFGIIESIWDIFLDDGMYLSREEICELYEDDIPDDQLEAEEFDEMITEKVNQFSMLQSFVAVLGLILKDKAPYMFSGEYSSESAEVIGEGIAILEKFGYSMADTAQTKLLDGTCPLYEEVADA